MPDATYIACPRCGEPFAMSAMQKRLYIGRTLTCQQCAKPFTITEDTPDPAPAPKARVWVPAPMPQAQAPVSPVAAPQASAPQAAKKRGDGLTAGRMAAMIALTIGIVGFLLYLALAPTIHRSRELGRRATCASNLLQIGVALQYYATANSGRFPDSLDAVVLDGSVPVELLVCPSSNDTPAPGKTPSEQIANLGKGNHVSYIYVGKGQRFAAAKQVLAYEALDHHDGEGVNVLYNDGTVQFLARPTAVRAIPGLAPPGQPISATQPTATTTPSQP